MTTPLTFEARARVRRLVCLILFVATFGGLAAAGVAVRPAAAQQPAASLPAESSVSVDQLQQLVATIEDETKRNELLTTLRGLIAAQKQTESEPEALTISGQLIAFLDSSYDRTRQSLNIIGAIVGGWPDWMAQIDQARANPTRWQRGVDAVTAFVTIFAIGWTAELLAWWVLSIPRRHADAARPRGAWERIWRGTIRVVIDLVPVAIFAAAAYVAALLIEPPRAVQSTALNFVNAYALARALLAVGRLLLSPRSVAFRPLPLSDATAKDLYRWARRFIFVGVTGFFIIAAAVLLGLPRQVTPVLYNMMYIVLAILAIIFIASHRRIVAHWLDHQATRCEKYFAVAPVLHGIAALWHILAIVYVLALLGIVIFSITNGVSYVLHGTLVTAVAIAVVAISLSLLRPSLRPRTAAVTTLEAPLASTVSLSHRLYGYVPFVRLGLGVVIAFGAAAFVLDAWGLGTIAWLQSLPGQRALGGALSILLTVVFAVVGWEIANTAIERYLTQSGREGESLRLPSARARTLLPLARKALVVVLTVMVVLITLSEIGINIAPLLAGAGVVGLAIGFGAQKMVQDVITGFFILVEDAIAVGDVVAVGGASGVVEDLSIRAIKLRDLAGSVHTVPFSSVDTVTNMTKTFSYYVVDVGVAYKEDTDQVAQVCREIVEEMRGEDAYGHNILAPLEVLGLDSFADSAVIVKVRIKTRPIKQWEVGREFNRRLKKRFDALNIEFPYPHRTIFFGTVPEPPAPVPSPPEAPAPSADVAPLPPANADAIEASPAAQTTR